MIIYIYIYMLIYIYNTQAEKGAAATAEFMRRQYHNAVQCPRCRAGPVIPEKCYDLQAHHGESSSSGSGRISNACPSCGFFSSERGDWVRWDAGWVFLYHQHGVVKKGSKQGSKKNQKKQQKKQQKQVSFALTLGLFCFDTRSLLL
jgi:hypothetical protein